MSTEDRNNIKKANNIGQSIWLDSISRDMIESGGLARLVETGISGVTSNPTIFDKAIAESDLYDDALVGYAADGADRQMVFERLAVDDVRDAADVLRPVYDAASGKDGFVSIEVRPTLAYDTEGTIEEARRLWSSIDRPNIMIKVPGTPEGVPAIRSLIGQGINVNVTLLFSLESYKAAAGAYVDGLTDYTKSAGDSLSGIASVASFFVSRVDTAADSLLPDGHELAGKIGIANAKVAYAEYQKIFTTVPGTGAFHALFSAGAQVQRPLWASTGVKNPAYSDTMYMDELMGQDTVNTAPPATVDAFMDHGAVEEAVTVDADVAASQIEQLDGLGISLDEITADLLAAGVKAFADSYDGLLDRIEAKLSTLAATGVTGD